MASLRIAAIAATLVALTVFPARAMAQTVEEVRDWMKWCESQGGTVVVTSSNPYCDPGASSAPADSGPSWEEIQRREQERADRREAKEQRRREQARYKEQVRLSREANRFIDAANAAQQAGRYKSEVELLLQALAFLPDDRDLRLQVMRRYVWYADAVGRDALERGDTGMIGELRGMLHAILELGAPVIASAPSYQAYLDELGAYKWRIDQLILLEGADRARAARIAAEAQAQEEAAAQAETRRLEQAQAEARLLEEARQDAQRQRLAAAEAHAPPEQRPFEPQGDGLVGGLGWQLGYSVAGASPEVKRQAREVVRDQVRRAHETGLADTRYDEQIDFDRFDFVVGIANSNDKWRDLFTRVAFEQLRNGQYTADYQPAYNALRGRQFDKLSCHSNGAMICLAALTNGEVQATDVVLYGPQITPESLRMWNRLRAEGQIQSLQIIVAQNDPVPPFALLFSPEGLARPITHVALTGALLLDVDRLSEAIRLISPEAVVTTFPCGSVPSADCHDIARYTDFDRRCPPPGTPRPTVPGTRLPGGPGVPEPPPPGCR